MFDPDREAHQGRGDLERRAGDACVRHPPGVLDERLDAPQRLGQEEDLRTTADLEGPLLRRGLEGDHPAEVPHLTSREYVPGMVGQARVVDALDRRVATKELGDLRGTAAVRLHANGE